MRSEGGSEVAKPLPSRREVPEIVDTKTGVETKGRVNLGG